MLSICYCSALNNTKCGVFAVHLLHIWCVFVVISLRQMVVGVVTRKTERQSTLEQMMRWFDSNLFLFISLFIITMTNKVKQLPSWELLNELYEYKDGQLILRSNNGRRKAGDVAGSNVKEYRRVTIQGVDYYVHRVIWKLINKVEPPEELDHIDRNPLNNRIENLRPATRSEQNKNKCFYRQKPRGKYSKGTRPHGNKWIACGYDAVAKKSIYLGMHETEAIASAAYQAFSSKQDY